MTQLPQLTLRRSVYGFVLVSLLIVVAVIGSFLYLRSHRLLDSTLDYAVRYRTEAAAAQIARALEEDWRTLRYLAQDVDLLDPAASTPLLDGIKGDGSRISWVGFADMSGRVRSASGGLLVGEDASARNWFQRGVRQPYAGDVRNAVMLARLLGSTPEDPLRFLDLAHPVRNDAGEVIGVVALFLDSDWFSAYLNETADILRMDLFLLSASGGISFATVENDLSPGELQILRAAQVGTQGSARETWPDGGDYFSSLVSRIGYGDLPNFGWRLVGRLDVSAINPGLDLVRSGGLTAALATIVLLAVLTLFYARIFARPFTHLARSASRIAGGSDEYPPTASTTREAAELSAALIRLQRDHDASAEGRR